MKTEKTVSTYKVRFNAYTNMEVTHKGKTNFVRRNLFEAEVILDSLSEARAVFFAAQRIYRGLQPNIHLELDSCECIGHYGKE